MKIFLYYLLIINLYGVFLMYSDKRKSIKGKWRVPEASLFFISLILGSFGILAGMYLFRHKTKHKKFVFFVPLICFAHLYILFRIYKMLGS